jgi:hypothetical protein
MFQFFKNLLFGKSLSGIIADLESKLTDLKAHAAAKSQEAFTHFEAKSVAVAEHLETISGLKADHAVVTAKLDTLAADANAEAICANAIAENLSTLLVVK